MNQEQTEAMLTRLEAAFVELTASRKRMRTNSYSPESVRYAEQAEDSAAILIAAHGADTIALARRASSAESENAKLRRAMYRQHCGCTSADCPRHGSYVPEEVDFYYDVVDVDPSPVPSHWVESPEYARIRESRAKARATRAALEEKR